MEKIKKHAGVHGVVLAGHVVSCGAVLLVSNRQRRRWPEFKIQTVSLPELLNDPHHPNHPSRLIDHTARACVGVGVRVCRARACVVWVCVRKRDLRNSTVSLPRTTRIIPTTHRD